MTNLIRYTLIVLMLALMVACSATTPPPRRQPHTIYVEPVPAAEQGNTDPSPSASSHDVYQSRWWSFLQPPSVRTRTQPCPWYPPGQTRPMTGNAPNCSLAP